MKKTIEPSNMEDRTSIAFSDANGDKFKARITGCFFIAATVTAIIGLKLYDPVLSEYHSVRSGGADYSKVVLGAVFEMILIVSNCGTAIMLYPYLKRYNPQLAMGYYTFRLLECVFILLGIVSVLSLLTLSELYTNTNQSEAGIYQVIAYLLRGYHEWTFILGPKFMLGINTFIYSYVFYRTGLVPKKLALLGLAGAVMVFINSLLELFGIIGSLSVYDLMLAFPIASYEMILAVWLIRKGFQITEKTNIL